MSDGAARTGRLSICMLHSDLPPDDGGAGGVRHQVHRLSTALAERGHAITVRTYSPRPRSAPYAAERLPGAGVVAGRPLLGMGWTPLAFGAARYRRFDIVHAHGDNQLLLRRSPPVVRTFYGSSRDEARHATSTKGRWSNEFHAVGEKIGCRLATATVGISEATRGALPGIGEIIPCGVDIDAFTPGEKAAEPTVLFVGRMAGRKRGHLVQDAFRRVVKPRVPDARLVLVAADAVSDGPDCTVVRDAGDAELRELMRRAWVFTMPSSYEGFGVPYVEAMASGTAVVSTDNAGAREIIRDGGAIVPDDELGGALAAMLEDGPRRGAAAAAGRQEAARFDFSVIADRYEDLYRRVLADR